MGYVMSNAARTAAVKATTSTYTASTATWNTTASNTASTATWSVGATGTGWSGSTGYVVGLSAYSATGTGPILKTGGNWTDPVEELKMRCEMLEEWYSSRLYELVNKIEEQEVEKQELIGRIEALEETLKKLVETLVKANED